MCEPKQLLDEEEAVKEDDPQIGMSGNWTIKASMWIRRKTTRVQVFPLIWPICSQSTSLVKTKKGWGDITTCMNKPAMQIAEKVIDRESTFSKYMVQYVEKCDCSALYEL